MGETHEHPDGKAGELSAEQQTRSRASSTTAVDPSPPTYKSSQEGTPVSELQVDEARKKCFDMLVDLEEMGDGVRAMEKYLYSNTAALESMAVALKSAQNLAVTYPFRAHVAADHREHLQCGYQECLDGMKENHALQLKLASSLAHIKLLEDLIKKVQGELSSSKVKASCKGCTTLLQRLWAFFMGHST